MREALTAYAEVIGRAQCNRDRGRGSCADDVRRERNLSVICVQHWRRIQLRVMERVMRGSITRIAVSTIGVAFAPEGA